MLIVFRRLTRSLFVKFGYNLVEFFKGNGLVGGSLPFDVDGVQHLEDFVIVYAVS